MASGALLLPSTARSRARAPWGRWLGVYWDLAAALLPEHEVALEAQSGSRICGVRVAHHPAVRRLLLDRLSLGIRAPPRRQMLPVGGGLEDLCSHGFAAVDDVDVAGWEGADLVGVDLFQRYWSLLEGMTVRHWRDREVMTLRRAVGEEEGGDRCETALRAGRGRGSEPAAIAEAKGERTGAAGGRPAAGLPVMSVARWRRRRAALWVGGL
jgi:hypothetical protein